MDKRSFFKALALCLLIAGTLDISDALIFYGLRGVPPLGLLRFIAACLVGVSALHGGLGMAALGLAIHYTSGLLYGSLIYLIMNFVVLPLTRLPPRTHHLAPAVLINGVLALVLFMGLPIALIARHFMRE